MRHADTDADVKELLVDIVLCANANPSMFACTIDIADDYILEQYGVLER